jgi:hypothetical protein
MKNFVNERDQHVKPLSFGNNLTFYIIIEQWVSVVSKYLDNKAIVTIGNQIKEKASQTNNNEKIMENRFLKDWDILSFSVEPFDLIIMCYEE